MHEGDGLAGVTPEMGILCLSICVIYPSVSWGALGSRAARGTDTPGRGSHRHSSFSRGKTCLEEGPLIPSATQGKTIKPMK